MSVCQFCTNFYQALFLAQIVELVSQLSFSFHLSLCTLSKLWADFLEQTEPEILGLVDAVLTKYGEA